MIDITTPICAGAGFFAGMLLWLQFTRWLGLLYVTGSKEGGDFLGPPKRRLLWAFPLVAILHPAPWLIVATGIFAFRTMLAGGGGSWNWFFGGMSIALLFMLLITLSALARWRRLRHTQASAPDKSLDRTHEE